MRTVLFFVILLFIYGCNHKKEPPPFYGPDSSEDIDYAETENKEEFTSATYGEIVNVPFTEKGGVKFVEVKLNDAIGVEMILDSGCSGALISVNEANYLYNKGVLTTEDIEGMTQSIIANGSVEVNAVVNIRKIVIGNKIECTNVKATVAENPQAPLLLGNDVLDRVASYEVDNKNKVINFRIG